MASHRPGSNDNADFILIIMPSGPSGFAGDAGKINAGAGPRQQQRKLSAEQDAEPKRLSV
jgi:hypothetical protein